MDGGRTSTCCWVASAPARFFCYLGAAIYDEKALLAADLDGPYEIHLKIFGDSDAPLQGPKLVPEETFTWWV
jgi:hypothetical protein